MKHHASNKATKKPFRLYVDASPLAEERITGIPHFTVELVRALAQHPDNGKKFDLVLVIPFDKASRIFRWEYTNVHIKRLLLPMRLFNLIWKYNLLPPMDVILGGGVYVFPNYKNWRLVRSFSLTYIHDLGFIRYPQFVQPKNLEFLKSNIERWISRTDMVVTGSDHARDEIIELLNVMPNKIVRIYHGVDHEQYYPRSKEDVEAATKQYNVHGKYILYIGSIEPRKNLTRLIASYCQLPEQLRSQYSLCLIGGGGWLNDKILADIELAQKGGYKVIKPEEYVADEDLPSLISGATLLVHPALYEGFGLSSLQAMACGTPVLVADNSSLPEVVGEAGIRVNAEVEKDISGKMLKVLSDKKLRSLMIARGLQQAKMFTWEKSAQELVKCIQEVTSMSTS